MRQETTGPSTRNRVYRSVPVLLAAGIIFAAAAAAVWGQSEPAAQGRPQFEGRTAQEYNQRLEQLRQMLDPQMPAASADEYRIGPDDLLEITVFEAPELNRSQRVSAGGQISLPLLGAVQAGSLTPRELEFVLEELLRRTYIKEPHVGVFVREMQSHAVSVFGAVKKPGVFQVRGAKTVVELLSMAEGLAEDAGDTVLVMRGAGFQARGRANVEGEAPPAEASPAGETAAAAETSATEPATSVGPGTIEINLKQLLASGDPRWNSAVYPGDVVKVTRAGIVYVVGEVKKPGGFLLKSNENISVLQAIALAEGLTRTSAKSHARIIRTEERTGTRTEIAINLGKILSGKAADPVLRPKDIVFIPNSDARSGLYRASEAAITTISGLIVLRR